MVIPASGNPMFKLVVGINHHLRRACHSSVANGTQHVVCTQCGSDPDTGQAKSWIRITVKSRVGSGYRSWAELDPDAGQGQSRAISQALMVHNM